MGSEGIVKTIFVSVSKTRRTGEAETGGRDGRGTKGPQNQNRNRTLLSHRCRPIHKDHNP